MSEELNQPKIARLAQINCALCEALGLDPTAVLSATVNIGGDKTCIIEVRMFLDTEMADKMIDVIKRYAVVELT